MAADHKLTSAQGGARMEVYLRWDPCRCGCKGQDPWHARTLTRRVRDIVVQGGEANTPLGRVSTLAEGFIQVPWSEDPVRVVLATHYGRAWTWVRVLE